MENLTRNMAQKITRSPRSRAQKRNPQWTLMMVSDDGEVKTARQGNGLRNLLLVLLAISLASAGAFYVLWDRARSESEALQEEVTACRQRLSSLGDDPQTSSTVMTVYRPAPKASAGLPSETGPQIGEKVPSVRTPTSEPPADSGPRSGSDMTPFSYGDGSNSAAPLVSPVGIEDFETAIGELSGALTIEFKVTNIDPDMEKAEGHAILVLRPEAGGGGGLALPPVTLIGGRPTGDQEGRAFSISNFRRIRFTAGAETHPERFEIATVFIFNQEGELWMEEDFPIRPETSQ